MLGNGLWQRAWGALPLLGRGNIEVTWVGHFGDKADFSGMRQDVTSMLPVETRPNIAETLYTSAFSSMILPRYLFFWVVSMTGDVTLLYGEKTGFGRRGTSIAGKAFVERGSREVGMCEKPTSVVPDTYLIPTWLAAKDTDNRNE